MLTHMYRIAVLFLFVKKNASLTNQLMRQHRERKQIFNILLILGVSSFITPITLDVTAVYDTIILIIASIVVYVSAISKREIQRKEGILFLVCYFAFFLYVFMR